MESTEKWMPVVGYEGLYEVSDCGRVRGLDRTDAGGRRWPGRIMQLSKRDSGHLVVHLASGGKRKVVRVHRAVLEAFVGPCPVGMEACHSNGIPDDNRVENLRWDTRRSNILDQIAHGVHRPSIATHCPHGHSLAAPNLEPSRAKRGRRNCLACTLARRDAVTCREPFSNAVADSYYAKIMAGLPPRPERTHCAQGHVLDGANLVPHQIKNGRRTCRACEAAKGIARRRGAEFDPALADDYYRRYVPVLGSAPANE